jgi:epoxyqueuosine reductase
MPDASTYTRLIKEEAARLGFLSCGIAKADFLADQAPHLENWLKNGRHGKLAYMENHFDKRLDPRLLVDDAKSVISLSFNYATDQKQLDPNAPKISKYAYGTDYHFVIKEKLKALLHFIQEEIGEVGGRAFVDSAPVLDKAWAERAGLGWVGKHSLLLSKNQGSFFFLAELIVDLELSYDQHMATDHCGTCTRCVDACPTDALQGNKVVDASRCISYLTIELKDNIPDEFQGKMDNWMFGCDICQDVCPWNRFSINHHEPAFSPHPDLLRMTREDWQDITEETFSKIFKKSAVKRTKYAGLKRNIAFLDQHTSTTL